jgi:hypothetical protein
MTMEWSDSKAIVAMEVFVLIHASSGTILDDLH